MEDHISSILTSFHARLNSLENSVHLAGRDIPESDDMIYGMETLKKLKDYITNWNRRKQLQNQGTLQIIGMSDPKTDSNYNTRYLFGQDPPFVHVWANDPNLEYQTNSISVLCADRKEKFKYRVKYSLRAKFNTRPAFTSRGVSPIENVNCNNEQEVAETLDSLLYPNPPLPVPP